MARRLLANQPNMGKRKIGGEGGILNCWARERWVRPIRPIVVWGNYY